MPICLQRLNTDAHWTCKALVFQRCMRCPECLHVHHAVLTHSCRLTRHCPDKCTVPTRMALACMRPIARLGSPRPSRATGDKRMGLTACTRRWARGSWCWWGTPPAEVQKMSSTVASTAESKVSSSWACAQLRLRCTVTMVPHQGLVSCMLPEGCACMRAWKGNNEGSHALVSVCRFEAVACTDAGIVQARGCYLQALEEQLLQGGSGSACCCPCGRRRPAEARPQRHPTHAAWCPPLRPHPLV